MPFAHGRSISFLSSSPSTSEVGVITLEENLFWLSAWLENSEDLCLISWMQSTLSSGTDGCGWQQWCQCRKSQGDIWRSYWWQTASLQITQLPGEIVKFLNGVMVSCFAFVNIGRGQSDWQLWVSVGAFQDQYHFPWGHFFLTLEDTFVYLEPLSFYLC